MGDASGQMERLHEERLYEEHAEVSDLDHAHDPNNLNPLEVTHMLANGGFTPVIAPKNNRSAMYLCFHNSVVEEVK